MGAANSDTPAAEEMVPAIVIAVEEMVPAIVIAAPGSGSGKTSISIGLAAALRADGEDVQCFKVGPDYLDPTFLTAASGRQCWNLDSWMTTGDTVKRIYSSRCASASFAIVEGVMGLFDGASPEERTGSTAEIAALLNLPVLLVIDVSGQARSAAAVVQGFVNFDPEIKIAGVIANYCGSAGHAEIIRRALDSAGLPPLVGWFQKQSLPALPERHLGLHAAHRLADGERLIAELGAACAAALDLPRIRSLAANFAGRAQATPDSHSHANPQSPAVEDTGDSRVGPRPRIGIARDEAFYFYYADNLAALEAAGAELVEFSPLGDAELPAELAGVYIGGGYPEEFAAELAANTSMCAALREFRGVIYAECGGLMYLSETLIDRSETAHAMVGLLAFSTRMLARRKMLGYVETELTETALLGPAGQRSRGHEFHYSEIVLPPVESAGENKTTAEQFAAHLQTHGFRQVAKLHGRRSKAPRIEGFQSSDGRIFASYVHQHFASNPALAANLVRAAERTGALSRTKAGELPI